MSIEDAIDLQLLKIEALKLKSKTIKDSFEAATGSISRNYNVVALTQNETLLSDAHLELAALLLLKTNK